jgi:glycosyltransferase involved in cell wall biosynthesis
LVERLTQRYGIVVEVIRLMLPGDATAGGDSVVMDLNPRGTLSAQLGAERANRCDLALVRVDRHLPLSHIDEFVAELRVPVVLCVDEVAAVDGGETALLSGMATRVSVVVVHSEVARIRLEEQVGAQVAIEVIPHGSPWMAMSPRPGPHRNILTWGFFAPGMGSERVVRALPLLSHLDPPPRYRLVSVTDPGWSRGEAASYRSRLTMEAENLGVADQLEVVPMLHSRAALQAEIAWSDLIAVVYDSSDLAGSRILTEAVSTGRPVVATAFPGAEEMLASGAGTTVVHDDDEAMARAIGRYLTDDEAYGRAAGVASALSASLSWDEIARRYALLINQRADSRHLAGDNRS